MSEIEDTSGSVRPSEAHEGWLAMKSAYAEYMRASEVFENRRESTPDSADSGHSELTLLDWRGAAFERYLEARLEYLEHRFDEGYQRQAAPVSQPPQPAGETGGFRAIFQPSGAKWLMPVLAVGILSVTAFSLVLEQKHGRDVDSVRDQLRANSSDTLERLQLLAKKLDDKGFTERSAVHQVEHTAQPPASAPQVDRRRASRGAGSRHLPERITKSTTRSVAARSYFSLSRSSQFKRVGPITVWFRSVDVQRNSVDVAVVSQSGKVDLLRLRLNQPVSIRQSYRGQPTELVVDRITANGLSGHLIEFQG